MAGESKMLDPAPLTAPFRLVRGVQNCSDNRAVIHVRFSSDKAALRRRIALQWALHKDTVTAPRA
jgi:hypothetical protein